MQPPQLMNHRAPARTRAQTPHGDANNIHATAIAPHPQTSNYF